MNVLKAHCPRCNGDRSCDIHGSLDQPWDWTDGEHTHNGQRDHRLLQCRGCEMVFYRVSSWDSEDWDGTYNPATGAEEISPVVRVTTYPAPEEKAEKPDWAWSLSEIDPALAAIMDETYRARDVGSLILASVGLRTALDRATEMLKIDAGHTLDAKVEKLLENGFVGETEAMTLKVVADAGNAAAHRGWSPGQAEFETLIATLEQFIQRTIVSGKAALEIAARIPPRHPRPAKAKTS